MNVLIGVLMSLQLQAGDSPWPRCEEHRAVPKDPVADAEATWLARRFAPVLSFGPGERYFPTIPFFSAFDGDGEDFRDPWEVAPYLRNLPPAQAKDSLHVSWKELLKLYHPEPARAGEPDHGAMEYALKRAVVLYRICSLPPDQNEKVIRFLKSDEQAFDRFEEVRALDSILRGPAHRGKGKDTLELRPTFDVIQYFLYYLADRGLQGHPNDIELVSVFLPTDSLTRGQFRIVVGSGHTARTPNNVLVLSAFHRGEARLDDSNFVMVELGGHSSAPDVRPYGKFTPGLDANWHAYDVWGTRDAQSSSGVGYMGQYEQSMTFDRGLGSVGIFVFPPDYDTTAMRRTTQAIQGPVDTAAEKVAQERGEPLYHQYRLLPVHLLFQLDSALEDGVDLDALSEAVSAIQWRLCPPRRLGPEPRLPCVGADSVTWSSERFSDLPDSTRRRAVEAMLRWKRDLIIDTTYNRFEPRNQALPGLPRIVEELSRSPRQFFAASKHRPWDHESFKGACRKGKCVPDPTQVFKVHLFRPNTYTAGLTDLLLLGSTVAPTDGFELYTGIVIPAFRSHGLPIRTGGFTELQIGINRGWEEGGDFSPTFRILQQGHRNHLVSYYLSASWVPRRPHVIQDPDAGEFSFSGGASLLPWLSTKTAGFPNVIRLRAGIRLDPLEGGDLLSRVRWELHLAVRQ